MSKTLKGARVERIFFQIAQADLIANNTIDLIAPIDGYLTAFRTTVDKAVTTGGTLTPKTGVALATTVAGMVQTIANAATKGTIQTTEATAKSATKKVSAGDRIAIVPAGFATAGGINGFISIHDANEDPAL